MSSAGVLSPMSAPSSESMRSLGATCAGSVVRWVAICSMPVANERSRRSTRPAVNTMSLEPGGNGAVSAMVSVASRPMSGAVEESDVAVEIQNQGRGVPGGSERQRLGG